MYSPLVHIVASVSWAHMIMQHALLPSILFDVGSVLVGHYCTFFFSFKHNKQAQNDTEYWLQKNSTITFNTTDWHQDKINNCKMYRA